MQQRIARFNRILKIREDSRRNEQAILAAERSEERAVINHINKLEGEKAQAIQDFSTTGEKMISATDLWFQRQFTPAEVSQRKLSSRRSKRRPFLISL